MLADGSMKYDAAKNVSYGMSNVSITEADLEAALAAQESSGSSKSP